MDEGKICVRYARALSGLAKQKQMIDLVREDMEMIQRLFDTIPEFNQVLQSPVTGLKEKRKLFGDVFADSLNPMTYSFLMLLLTNHREALQGIFLKLTEVRWATSRLN
jgi:F0F1-type ATP synthase delta subunit